MVLGCLREIEEEEVVVVEEGMEESKECRRGRRATE